MKKNFYFVADYAVMIITDESEESARETLREYVKDPTEFCLDHSEPV